MAGQKGHCRNLSTCFKEVVYQVRILTKEDFLVGNGSLLLETKYANRENATPVCF